MVLRNVLVLELVPGCNFYFGKERSGYIVLEGGISDKTTIVYLQRSYFVYCLQLYFCLGSRKMLLSLAFAWRGCVCWLLHNIRCFLPNRLCLPDILI